MTNPESPVDSPATMTADQFGGYLSAAAYRAAQHPEWRMGQAYFNVLHELYPEVADTFRGKAADPFHRDDLVPDFLSALWEDCVV